MNEGNVVFGSFKRQATTAAFHLYNSICLLLAILHTLKTDTICEVIYGPGMQRMHISYK
jgi:hypothetical protein